MTPPAEQRLRIRHLVMHYVPIVAWLPAYDRADLRFDAIAGIVSWGVMVPVAMAYAGLAGMPPETGLVTAFAAMALYAVFGTSRHLKVTTSSSIAIMSASVVAAIAASDPSLYVPLSAGLAVIVGLILVVAGLARLGFLSQFLAASVVTGFVIGLAVVITVGQIPALLGIPAGGVTIIDKLVNIVENLDELNPWTAWLGVGTVVGIVVLRRFARRIPGALVALVVGIGLSTLLDLEAHGVAVVGDVVTGIPPLSIPRVPLGDIVFLIAGAFGIVFLALAESIGAARSFATRHGYEIDPNQELVALGAANVGAGLFGGFSVDASFSQSATGEAAGNRTQLASLITAGAHPGHRRRPRAAVRQPAALGAGGDRHHVRAGAGQPGGTAPLPGLEADRLPAGDDRAGRGRVHDAADGDGDRRCPVAVGDPVPGQPAVHRGPRPHPRRPADLRRRGTPPGRRAGSGLPHRPAQRPLDLRQRRRGQGPDRGPGRGPGRAAPGSRPRHRRDGRSRRGDDGHAGDPVRGPRGRRDRASPRPGARHGP